MRRMIFAAAVVALLCGCESAEERYLKAKELRVQLLDDMKYQEESIRLSEQVVAIGPKSPGTQDQESARKFKENYDAAVKDLPDMKNKLELCYQRLWYANAQLSKAQKQLPHDTESSKK